MLKIVTSALIIALLSACVSTKSVPFDELKALEHKPSSLTQSNREKPDFSAMTAGKAMFALIGAAAMISAGNKIVEENSIEDPAIYISHEIAKALADKYELKIHEQDQVINTRKDKAIAQAYAGSDWILDVETINWSFGYFPTDWNNYRVMYSAKLKLIDAKNSNVLAEGFCSRVPEYSESAPSHDELLADQAERLKLELKTASNICIDEFRSKILMLK